MTVRQDLELWIFDLHPPKSSWGYSGFHVTGMIEYHLMLFWKFLWLGNSSWDFSGLNFWFRDYLGVLFEAQGSFSGYDFCPLSIIPVN